MTLPLSRHNGITNSVLSTAYEDILFIKRLGILSDGVLELKRWLVFMANTGQSGRVRSEPG